MTFTAFTIFCGYSDSHDSHDSHGSHDKKSLPFPAFADHNQLRILKVVADVIYFGLMRSGLEKGDNK